MNNETLKYGYYPQKRITDKKLIKDLDTFYSKNNFDGYFEYKGRYYKQYIAF